MRAPTLNTHLLVRNLRGTARRRCPIGSWLDLHAALTGTWPTICAALDCANPVEDGAHVVLLDNRRPGFHFIAAVCHGCNMRIDDYFLKRSASLASARIG